MINLLIALFIYPGMLALIACGVMLAYTYGIRLPSGVNIVGSWRGTAGATVLFSLFILITGVILLPVPLNPIYGRWPVGVFPLVWVFLEVAFLLPLLPGLVSRLPLVARAASRAAQLGIAGRAVLWVAASAGMISGSALIDLPGRVMALIAGLMVLPAAAGIGPFGPEQSLAPVQESEELDGTTQALLPFVRAIQAAALAFVLVAALIPTPWINVQAFGILGVVVVLVLTGIALILLRGRPRFTLPMGLNWCWRRALPLALASLVYSMIV